MTLVKRPTSVAAIKSKLGVMEMSKLFQTLIEECAEHLIPFLDNTSIRHFRYGIQKDDIVSFTCYILSCSVLPNLGDDD